jgi:signal transduction histidine kinase
LSNVARHARASRVAVTLSYLPDRVMLDISDDGVGFAHAAGDHQPRQRGVDHGGFGLEAMRQRVTALGGELQVETAPGRGAVVSVALPVIAAVEPTR